MIYFQQSANKSFILVAVLLVLFLFPCTVLAQQEENSMTLRLNQAAARVQQALEKAEIAADQAKKNLEKAKGNVSDKELQSMRERVKQSNQALQRIKNIRQDLDKMADQATGAQVEKEAESMISVARTGASTAEQYSKAVQELVQGIESGQASLNKAKSSEKTYNQAKTELNNKNYSNAMQIAQNIDSDQRAEDVVGGGPGEGPPEGTPGPPDFVDAPVDVNPGSTE